MTLEAGHHGLGVASKVRLRLTFRHGLGVASKVLPRVFKAAVGEGAGRDRILLFGRQRHRNERVTGHVSKASSANESNGKQWQASNGERILKWRCSKYS